MKILKNKFWKKKFEHPKKFFNLYIPRKKMEEKYFTWEKKKKEKPENVVLKAAYLSDYDMELIISSMTLTLEDMNEFLPNSFTKVHVYELGISDSIVEHNITHLAYAGDRLKICFHCRFYFASVEDRNTYLQKKEDDILEKNLPFQLTSPLKNLPSQYENIKGIETKYSNSFLNAFHKSIRLLWTHGNFLHKLYIQCLMDEQKRLKLALQMVERITQFYN